MKAHTKNPYLNLRLASSLILPPNFYFHKNTTTNVVSQDGWLVEIPAHKPAFEWDYKTGECLGMVFSNQNSNYLLHSEDFSQSWAKASVTIDANTGVNPRGLNGYQTLTATSTNALLSTTVAIPSRVNACVSFSFFVKYDPFGARYLRINLLDNGMQSGTTDMRVTIDLQEGVVVGGSVSYTRITHLAGGWLRVSLGSIYRSTESTRAWTNPLISIAGWSDTNGTVKSGLWFGVWGGQINGNTGGSGWYIRTTTTALIDSITQCWCDVSDIDITNQIGTYFDFLSERPCGNNGFVASLSAANAVGNYIGMHYVTHSSIGGTYYLLNTGSVNIYPNTEQSNSNLTILNRIKSCFSWDSDRYRLVKNGSTFTDIPANPAHFPKLLKLSLGARVDTTATGSISGWSFSTNGWLKDLLIYREAIDAEVMQAIVS